MTETRSGSGLVTAVLLVGLAGPAAGQGDPACQLCIRDEIAHVFRIQNHPVFNDEQGIAEGCANIEFPEPILRVSADGTKSSFFEVQRVVVDGCQSSLVQPAPVFLDDFFQIVSEPDPAVYGVLEQQQRLDDSFRYAYTHPTEPPPPGQRFRELRMGIAYFDAQDPTGPVIGSVVRIHVHRPPVLFTHGLWSDASGFAAMASDLAGDHYAPEQLRRVDYAPTNDAHFATNASEIPDGIDALIQQGADAGFAAGRVDLVGHSMGGILSRLYVQGEGYAQRREVRRIVTSNTPHAGAQTADLLLDRDFDPLGLQCRVVSGLLRLSGFPQRGCDNGAVEDLRVTSPAILEDLDQGSHPSEVEVHAVATVFDVADLPPLSTPAQVVQAPLPTLLANLLQQCGNAAVARIFNQDDHDLVVAAGSQAGGLEGERTSLYPGLVHVGSVADPGVIDAVRDLLQEPEGSTRFTTSGYAPEPLPYLGPGPCPSETPGAALASGAAPVEAPIAISQPAADSVVAPGDTLGVAASGSVARMWLVMGQRADALRFAQIEGAAGSVDFPVPEDANGELNLLALGLDGDGRLVGVSAPVTVRVVPSAPLEALEVEPATVYLQPCDSASLRIRGQYSDGVERSLDGVSGLDFAFAEGSAVRSGPRELRLEAAADDSLTVSLGGVESGAVPIRALPGPEPPDGACPVPEPGASAAAVAALVALGALARRSGRRTRG